MAVFFDVFGKRIRVRAKKVSAVVPFLGDDMSVIVVDRLFGGKRHVLVDHPPHKAIGRLREEGWDGRVIEPSELIDRRIEREIAELARLKQKYEDER